MENLINEYLQKFDENFPLFMFMNVNEDEVKRIIKKCIDEGKPYIDLETDENILY